MKSFLLKSCEDTLQFAARLAPLCAPPFIIHLQGDLGAGKTTFSRGFLQSLNFNGNVKSPTYTLVEPYELKDITVFHFDLYRLHHPQELIELGMEDYCDDHSICLIEWPDKGGDFVPAADIICHLQLSEAGRCLTLYANNAMAKNIIESLA